MYGMRFAQIAQDMCNYLDAQTQDLAPNEALAAKKMVIRKLCRGEGLDDMIAPQSALSTKRKQSVGPNVPKSLMAAQVKCPSPSWLRRSSAAVRWALIMA